MCVLAGCDYLKNIRHLGINLAYMFVTKVFDIDGLYKMIADHRTSDGYKKFIIPDEQQNDHMKAETTFMYQLIYEPKEAIQCRFNECKGDTNLDYAGE